ncbi:MAG: integrase, partial [Alphaproteobacteria bacterium]
MRELPRLWDALHFRGADWQVVAYRDGCLALSPLQTGKPVVVAGTELLLEPDYRLLRRGAAPRLDRVDLLDMLPAQTRSRALFLQRHIVEVLTGTPPDAPEASRPRAEFSPAESLRSRVEAKARELEQVGIELSGRSLWRYVTRYRSEGVNGLIDLRGQRASPSRRISPQLVAIAEDVMCRQTYHSTRTRSHAFASIERAAAEQGVEVPSRATVYRLLGRLDRQRHSFGNATTRRTQANRPNRAYGQQVPSRPGELVEIDSTPLDVLVLYPDGGSGRVDLTLALDIATRTILAAVLSPVAAKAVDAALLLARAMTPPMAQPGWADAVRFSRSLLPEGVLAEPEVLAAELRERPVVSIESVTIDRGRVFVSSTFLAACERLQISLVKAAPRTPTDKPHVERMFGSINTLFTQYLTGYTGPNVVRRGQDVAAEALWPLAQVQDLLDQWIVQSWQNRPHSGLRLPAVPQQHLTPNEMLDALSAVAPGAAVVFDTDDYIALLPRVWRTVQRYGINFAGLTYDSPALGPFRNVRSGIRSPEACDKWEVRYDPYRVNRVYLRNHEAGCWVEVAWTLEAQTLAPFGIDVLRAAQAAVARRADRPAATAAALLAEINRIQSSLTAENRTERSA